MLLLYHIQSSFFPSSSCLNTPQRKKMAKTGRGWLTDGWHKQIYWFINNLNTVHISIVMLQIYECRIIYFCIESIQLGITSEQYLIVCFRIWFTVNNIHFKSKKNSESRQPNLKFFVKRFLTNSQKRSKNWEKYEIRPKTEKLQK